MGGRNWMAEFRGRTEGKAKETLGYVPVETVEKAAVGAGKLDEQAAV
jgi:hypothetical protein